MASVNGVPEIVSPSKEEYKRRLAEGLMGGFHDQAASRILSFKSKAPAPPEGFEPCHANLYSANAGPRPARKQFRNVPTAPERVRFFFKVYPWMGCHILFCVL